MNARRVASYIARVVAVPMEVEEPSPPTNTTAATNTIRSEDADLAAAIAASLGSSAVPAQSRRCGVGGGGAGGEDAVLAAAIAASLGGGHAAPSQGRRRGAAGGGDGAEITAAKGKRKRRRSKKQKDGDALREQIKAIGRKPKKVAQKEMRELFKDVACFLSPLGSVCLF